MSLGDRDRIEDYAVIQYLVGATPAEQAELLDRLSVSDDDFARRLEAVEDDLVDAYVRAELSGETLERFRSFYLSSPLRREKVRLAEALLRVADRRAPVPAVPARRFRLSFPRLLAAAAASLVVAAAVYWTLSDSRPSTRLQPAVATAPQPPAPRTPAPLPGVLFALAPPTRGAGELPVLALPSNAPSVTFRLEMEANDSLAYRVALKDLAANRIVWQSERLSSVVELGVPSLVFNVPAGLLEHRAYSLDLTGFAASGAGETIGAYAFRVVAK